MSGGKEKKSIWGRRRQCGILEAGTCLVCSRNNKEASVVWQEWSHWGCIWERRSER